MSISEQVELDPRPPLLHRLTPRQLLIVDVGIAGLLLLGTGLRSFGHGQSAADPSVFVVAVVIGLSVVMRRQAPLFALVVATASVAVVATTNFGEKGILEAFIAFPAYQVASIFDRRRSLPFLALACVAIAAPSLDRFHVHPVVLPASAIVAAVAAWFVGDSVRVRHLYLTGLAEQAAQRQREVVERAQRSVAEERLQIARELHDVVAHSLSVIAVQSGVGRHVIDTQPEEARKALGAVEQTSRSALTELRRMLGVLRRDDVAPATLVPAPDVAAIGPLVDQVRAAGFTVNLDTGGVAARALPPTIQLCMYRIVQEALTNVVKHAGPAAVHVGIREEADALVIEVTDDGRGVVSGSTLHVDPRAGDHHGIIGMRERVELFSGSLFAGPSAQGGFRVTARLPYDRLTTS